MPSTVPASSRVDRVLRFAAKAAVFVVGAFCALLLAIRLVAYPQIEAHRTEIAQWLGSKIGQPVEIDSIVTGWDGWNPRLSIRGFRVRERAGETGTLLELPRVDLLVAWTSLPFLDLRLKELLIVSPRLSVRRDVAGRLHVAGIEMASEDNVDDSAFAGWLMRQPQVVVTDALVAWNDELRRAPQLLLDHVQFRLEQRLGHHRAGLTGVPPAELAAPIDLRADVTGKSLTDLQSLRGKLYLRLDYADVSAWREWLPLPFAIESGKGALRVWVDFAQSQATDVAADLELADVRATFGDNLAPLSLAHVAGRAEWKRDAARTEFTGRQLSVALPDGTGIAPTDLKLTLRTPKGGAETGGSLAFQEIDLRPLAAIAAHLPLPEAARHDLARLAPHGTVRNGQLGWTGAADAPTRYSVKADFQHVGITSRDALPGAANLSGSVDVNERGGKLRLAGNDATVTLPKLFAEPIRFDSVKGDVSWTRGGGETQVQWKDVVFANADASGASAGMWRSHPTGPGDVDLKAQLTRANLAGAHRYLPVNAAPAVRDWLRRALVKGTSSDATLAIAGDLALFPFPQGKGGQFQLAVNAHDATLDYADRWPPITDIAAEVRIDGSKLLIDASSARVQGAQIGATHAEIADLHDAHPVLHIDGTAGGPTMQFLAFVANSPVADWIGHFNDDASASGDGRLALKFELPLHDPAQTTIAGEYQFASNGVQMAGVPPLTDVNGKLLFTEHDIRATDLTARAFGGPVKVELASEGGRVHLTGSGTADVQQVRNEYDAPLLAHVTGSTDWKLTLDARDRQAAWSVESSLAGASIDLPAPIGKRASETVPLRIERHELKPQEDRIAITYGDIAKVLLHRRQPGGHTSVIDRALVLVGKAAGDAAEPEQPGVWIRADVASVNIDDWLAVDLPSEGTAKDARADALSINGIDLQASSLQALGRNFTGLKTTARRRNADWRLTLDGTELAGTATWRSATPTQPNGRLIARLTRLTPPASTESDATGNANAAATPSGADRHWPAVDLVADTLLKHGRALGKLELLAQPLGADWQIQKLALANDAGRIDAQGWWRNASGRSRTLLDVVVDVKEAGAFLGRFGWPDAVKGAATKIEGQVSWTGGPSEFDYPSLAGNFKLHSGPGQFTKLEPGVGRLLGVLSLQALPRRISLDFRDVFSEGFAFDSVAGDVRMDSGVMHTDALRLVGPAAVVNIAGDVDLARETQQLKVRVQPSLSSGVSVGAAALFIANPLLGAVVGAGTLLAQKMLNNPFDQLFSYQYDVSGSWDDPVVTRAGARDASAAQSSAVAR
ncbi:MAG: YhdP family protein [Casimicrobiaceae bacterium]